MSIGIVDFSYLLDSKELSKRSQQQVDHCFAGFVGLLLLGNVLLSVLCQRIDTATREGGQGHRRDAIHQDDEKEHRDQGKNVGGSYRPFFLPVYKAKRPARGLFGDAVVISVRGL
jgi:hypothetical protein